MFSQTVEYALRAVVQLAKEPELLQTTAQIATATEVPAPYLSKIMQAWTRVMQELAGRSIQIN